MPNSTLGALTAATAATGGLFYGTQSGADRKFAFTSAGATLIEAADAAAQRTALAVLPLTGGTLTGALTLPNAIFSGLSLTGSQATNTIDVSTAWNTTGNPTLIYGRATNTASGASANLLDLGTVAAGSLIRITKTGVISGPLNTLTLGTDPRISQANTNRPIELATTQGYTNIFDTIPRLGFSTTAGNTAPNECISRTAAFTYQFGLNTASTPNAQTIKAHDVTTGTGADLILSGGTGSGGNNGNVRFGTHSAWTAEVISGYITIKDAGGTLRKLAVIS